MVTPTATASLNKATFGPAETMTLTVTYGDADSDAGSVTVVVTDAAGNKSAPITVAYTINDPLTIALTDPERVWTRVSDTGSVAVYRSVA